QESRRQAPAPRSVRSRGAHGNDGSRPEQSAPPRDRRPPASGDGSELPGGPRASRRDTELSLRAVAGARSGCCGLASERLRSRPRCGTSGRASCTRGRGAERAPRFDGDGGSRQNESMTVLTVATRKSQLALAQARAWMRELTSVTSVETTELHVVTTGD